MIKEEKEILIGLILGDGHLTSFVGKSLNSSLDMKADNKYLSYLCWMHEKLSGLGVSGLRPKKGYHQHRFYTGRRSDIGELRALFYPQGKKIIPNQIGELLTSPLTLAVWYQDDGTLDCRDKYHYNAQFATHCFSYNECILLTEVLAKNFELDVRVCKCMMRGVLRYRLHVTSKSMERFIQFIKPFIQPCFLYKIRSRSSQQQR